jgi:hypothetical protein
VPVPLRGFFLKDVNWAPMPLSLKILWSFKMWTPLIISWSLYPYCTPISKIYISTQITKLLKYFVIITNVLDTFRIYYKQPRHISWCKHLFDQMQQNFWWYSKLFHLICVARVKLNSFLINRMLLKPPVSRTDIPIYIKWYV